MAGLGLIGSALAGGAVGLGAAGKQLGDYAAHGALQDEAGAIQAMRDKTLMAMKEEADIRAEGRKRAPALRAAKAAEQAIAGRLQATNEAGAQESGMLGAGGLISSQTALPEREEAMIRARALESEGETEAAHRYRQDVRDIDRTATGEKRLDLEAKKNDQRHEEMLKRLDAQEAHQKRTDSIAAGNAARMLAIAEEQIKGVKLDNEQKQQLADLDKEWKDATDDKTREAIAQRRALLTGKWNESFEVKTGKDGLGNDIVLGYIDKRRGTFTTNDGKVTDMRTGKASGSGGTTPSAEDIAGLKARASNPAAIQYFESRFGKGSAAPHVGGGKTPALFTDPITGEQIDASAWKKKYGEKPKRLQTEISQG